MWSHQYSHNSSNPQSQNNFKSHEQLLGLVEERVMQKACQVARKWSLLLERAQPARERDMRIRDVKMSFNP